MSTIVKIQRDPKSPCNKATVTNQCKSIEMHIDLEPEFEKYLGSNDTVYAKMSFSANKLRILGLVKKQNW